MLPDFDSVDFQCGIVYVYCLFILSPHLFKYIIKGFGFFFTDF